MFINKQASKSLRWHDDKIRANKQQRFSATSRRADNVAQGNKTTSTIDKKTLSCFIERSCETYNIGHSSGIF